MASLILGYNYDIFISYRQKDNKGDRWVSQFVEALKTELEATFKEDVSVYFDENPHDRLQESHDVEKSLEGKLKSLILIPIISQTYCDPKSYAWQSEFIPFLKMVEVDGFGKDVKLRSGNVASRILPIRIHDLEEEDIKLYEKETGSVLRPINFIFKTATGVNRPLKANEDHPQDNLNKIYYSDQINKVAGALKEIILGMKTEPVKITTKEGQPVASTTEVKEEEIKEVNEKPAKVVKVKFLIPLAILALLIIAGIMFYPRIFKRDNLERLRSSDGKIPIAVIPFINLSGDSTLNYLETLMQEEMYSSLARFTNELKVRRTESVNNIIKNENIRTNASISVSTASLISKKLDARVFINGIISKNIKGIRLNAQLINARNEEILCAFTFDGSSEESNFLIDSLAFLVLSFLQISDLQKENYAFRNLTKTYSPLAYRYFIMGNDARYKSDLPSALKYFQEAVKIDSNFIIAVRLLSVTYKELGNYSECKKWCDKLLSKREIMSLEERLNADLWYAELYESNVEIAKILTQLEQMDENSPLWAYNLGTRYLSLGQYENAIPKLQKALKIFDKWDSRPLNPGYYTNLGYSYHMIKQYRREEKIYKKAEHDFPDNPAIIYRQAVLAISEGKTEAANEYIEKYKFIRKENGATEAAIDENLGAIFAEAKNLDRAEEYYRQAYIKEPKSSGRMNTLAYFLIDTDININDGIEFAKKALDLSPDNFNYLHTKGWGLYKQGKYQEAYDILQKSWNLRMENAVYNHEAYLHLEAAKKAVDSQKIK